MLTTKFCHPDGSLWLPSELALELTKRGHSVTVLNVEWSGKDINPNLNSIEPSRLIFYNFKSLRLEGGRISIALRWVFSSFRLLPFLFRNIFFGNRYDLMIGFSPCVALYSALPLATAISRDSVLVYWDFFPVHNQEISNKIPKWVLPIVKWIEMKLIGTYSRVGCMSEANIVFFEKYFGKKSAKNKILLPIWTSILDVPTTDGEDVRLEFFRNPNAIIFVFGGQLVEGRGILEFCNAIIEAKKKNNDIALIVCGDGYLSKKIADIQESNQATIRYIGTLSRSDYLKVLSFSDVGVVSTVSNVSAPTFPSKSLDYMACSLPILAAVEDASDFGRIVEDNEFGYQCKAGDIESMVEVILKITKNKDLLKVMGKNGNLHLRRNHSVEYAANLITGDKIV